MEEDTMGLFNASEDKSNVAEYDYSKRLKHFHHTVRPWDGMQKKK